MSHLARRVARLALPLVAGLLVRQVVRLVAERRSSAAPGPGWFDDVERDDLAG